MTTRRRVAPRSLLLTAFAVAGLVVGAVVGRTAFLPDATRAVDNGYPNCLAVDVRDGIAELLPAGASAIPKDTRTSSGNQLDPGFQYSEVCSASAGGGTVSVRIHSVGDTPVASYETAFARAAGLSPGTAGSPKAGDGAKSWADDAVAHVTCTWEHHKGRSLGYGVEVHLAGAARGSGANHQRLVDDLLIAAAKSVRTPLQGPCDTSL
jgi:hypothetical protein